MLVLFRTLIFLVGISLSLIAAGNVPNTQVTSYTVTLKKLEIYNSTEGKWVLLSDNSATVDIASASAGASIASMVSADAAITFGTYTKARVKIGSTFSVTACGNVGDDCTTGGTAVSGGHTVAIAGDGNPVASAASVYVDFSAVTLPSGVTLDGTDVLAEYTFSSPLAISQGSTSPSIEVNFDVNNILYFDEALNYITVDFPTVAVTID